MITPEEYKQMNAFVRYDGLIVGLLMSLTFLLMMYGLKIPMLQLFSIACLVMTPLVVANRVRNYRDFVVCKRVSFMRAFAYSWQCFLYSGIILSLVGYIYMSFIDGGAFLEAVRASFSQQEMVETLQASGITPKELQEIDDYLTQLRPIDVAFSLMSNVISIGTIVSVLIAAVLKRDARIYNQE